ncbi:MAG: MFS transporter [Steroidobacteraceae bacterium]
MNTGAKPQWPPGRQAWYATSVLMIAYLFNYVDRQILSMLVKPIKADLALSDTQVSLLHGMAFAICYTVLGVWPVGRWADTGNRRNVIAGGVFLWSLMTTLCGRASTYGGLFLARIGVGIGESALTPSAYSMLADYFPPEKRGRALGLFAMGVYFGIGLSITIAGLVIGLIAAQPTITLPLLGDVGSWQVAFLVVGPPGLLVALWVLSLKEPARIGAGAQPGLRFGDALAYMLRHWRFYAAITVGVALLTLLFNAAAFWLPEFLRRRHGFDALQIAWTYGPTMFVFGALGIVSGGSAADSLRKRGRRDAELLTGMGSALGLIPCTWLVFQSGSTGTVLAAMAAMLFLSSFPFGACSAAVQLVTPNQFRARLSAIYLLVLNITGIGLGSTAAAVLTDYLFVDETRVGDSVTLIACCAAPLAALAFAGGRREYRRMQLGGATG